MFVSSYKSWKVEEPVVVNEGKIGEIHFSKGKKSCIAYVGWEREKN